MWKRSDTMERDRTGAEEEEKEPASPRRMELNGDRCSVVSRSSRTESCGGDVAKARWTLLRQVGASQERTQRGMCF